VGDDIKGTGYDTYIEDFIDEYGYLYCEKCGENEMNNILSRHHIFFRSEKPKHPNLHHKDNIILVCEKCHRKFHDKKSIREKLGEMWEKAKALFIK
jgi:5-methylcytosine-specific restriction endonuclease McrA